MRGSGLGTQFIGHHHVRRRCVEDTLAQHYQRVVALELGHILRPHGRGAQNKSVGHIAGHGMCALDLALAVVSGRFDDDAVSIFPCPRDHLFGQFGKVNLVQIRQRQ